MVKFRSRLNDKYLAMQVGRLYYFHKTADGMARRINRCRQKDPTLTRLKPITGNEVFLLEIHYRDMVRELYQGKGAPPLFDANNDMHVTFRAFLDAHNIPWEAVFRPVRSFKYSIDGGQEVAERSNNKRMEMYFGQFEGFVNREYTLPCGVNPEPVYQDQLLAGSTELQAVIKDNLRFIIRPSPKVQMPARMMRRIKVLASPREGGRVLEADEQVIIEDKPYTLTMKGVGMTQFARDGLANMRMTLPASVFPQMQEHLPRLRDLPFLERAGFQDLAGALKIVKRTRFLKEIGVDAAMILSVHEITALPKKNGKYRPLQYFRERGMVREDIQPVIMARTSRSNFRLNDLIEYPESDDKAAVQGFIDHILAEYRLHIDPLGTLQDYFAYLVKKVFQQKKMMLDYGIIDSANYWQNVAGNISILGEEMDVGNLRHWSDFEEGTLQGVFKKASQVLRVFGEVLNSKCREKIDLSVIERELQIIVSADQGKRELPDKNIWLS